jgi:hypothetical protein
MLKSKTPERVNDDACPAQEPACSDLVEVVRRHSEFRKWGMFWGPVLYLQSLKAAKTGRPKSFLWSGLAVVVTVIGGLVLRYGLPAFLG